MTANPSRFPTMSGGAAALLAGLLAASCAPTYSPPEQVQASSPSVTYKYRGDQDLIAANQRAVTFCNGYQSVPQAASFSTDPDGGKVVVFTCVQPGSPTVLTPASSPNLTYTYTTDPELLAASRTAQTYCMNTGSRSTTSSIATNANGTKTVSFRCVPQ